MNINKMMGRYGEWLLLLLKSQCCQLHSDCWANIISEQMPLWIYVLLVLQLLLTFSSGLTV